MGIQVKAGDFFCVQLHTNSFGLGVVAAKWNSELFVVMFEETIVAPRSEEIDFSVLTPLLASSSLDAKLYHGDWPIVKEDTNITALNQPIYKVEESQGTIAESFDRKIRVTVDSSIAEQLQYRKGVAPIRLEKALKAHHGDGVWEPHFNELLYQEVLRSNAVLVNAGLMHAVKPS